MKNQGLKNDLKNQIHSRNLLRKKRRFKEKASK